MDADRRPVRVAPRQYIERINQVLLGLDQTFDVSVYTLEHVLDVKRYLAEYANGGISLIYSSRCRQAGCPPNLVTPVSQTDRSLDEESICAHISDDYSRSSQRKLR